MEGKFLRTNEKRSWFQPNDVTGTDVMVCLNWTQFVVGWYNVLLAFEGNHRIVCCGFNISAVSRCQPNKLEVTSSISCWDGISMYGRPVLILRHNDDAMGFTFSFPSSLTKSRNDMVCGTVKRRQQSLIHNNDDKRWLSNLPVNARALERLLTLNAAAPGA